ncbi:hypothetical protein AGABI2DRAFT_194775 [Agaricus bisporus var. bisporus H97]|uniref:hypothetical protein n=1 Tax=Agaricus bisporus var. bisporus (strain H97 / ATCC MYA-4626 / FGSC 10389) TaxID=936046 RepID=UPI00029F614A|nr:hypothetical protein AGABI2DRAFT_194775 [Agaricus bisporus var. bisporus H97]EKV43830.1 hypothetical protein AGABI2DRAFT_194775 [Agaricus bisporus var. bisporus H97]
MRLSFALAVAALASTVSASLVARQASLPACALLCITQADSGDCKATDNVCLCNKERFLVSFIRCINFSCQGGDIETALNVGNQLCAAILLMSLFRTGTILDRFNLTGFLGLVGSQGDQGDN